MMTANLLVLAGLLGLLFPAGLALWMDSPSPARGKAANDGPKYVLGAAALGLVGYAAVGFALSFGGSARLYPALGELAALSEHWTPLKTSQGPGWAMAGAAGFFVAVGDDPGSYALFFFQAALLAAALSLFAAACSGRLRGQAFALLVMLFGWLLYPLAVAWTWGGGWLANLGVTRALGHGFVDAGGGAVLLSTGTAGLAVAAARAWAARSAADLPAADDSPRADSPALSAPAAQPPSSHSEDLPASAMAGAVAMTVGWLALLAGCALMMGTSLPLVLVNALAGASSGATVALAYMGFTTARLDGPMGARGLLAGLVATGVAGPFVTPAAAILIGATAGVMVCLTVYLAARLGLGAGSDVAAVFGAGATWGLLAVGLFAHGRTGQGWNGVGAQSYLGVPGQGVAGLWPSVGFLADPAQLAAQLAGAAAVALWVALPVIVLALIAGGPPESEGAPR